MDISLACSLVSFRVEPEDVCHHHVTGMLNYYLYTHLLYEKYYSFFKRTQPHRQHILLSSNGALWVMCGGVISFFHLVDITFFPFLYIFTLIIKWDI